ncbi:antibiotic biosynthesis monooxygenase [Streptomyces sp. NPDC046866]|uniref:antibiotic biosynthesis monooxygenase n=1 Tax=Streptomyces sp. NPDC046866 TaxID=3154921 RepID=UPI0034548D82
MYVRSIYATGDPAGLGGVAEVLRTEGRELLSAQPGFRGMGLFVDRELGKLLVGSWWEDAASQQASYDNLSTQRAEMIGSFAQTMTVERWEAAVARRAEDIGPDAGFRLVRMDVESPAIDLLVETFRDTALPRLQQVPGMAGISLLVDRDRGRAAVGALYTDREALAASRGTVAAVRGEATAKVAAKTTSLEEFEVVLATAVPHT